VLQEDNPTALSDTLSQLWSYDQEKNALAGLAWKVTAIFPKSALPPNPTIIAIRRLQTTYNHNMFSHDSVITSIETKGQTCHVHFSYLEFEPCWGFKSKSIHFEWGCHWQRVCAYRLERLCYPEVGASTASARFIHALITQNIPSPCFKMLRLYGMPVCPAQDFAIIQVMPYKFVKIRQTGACNYRVGCIVHPDPIPLLSGALGVLVSKFKGPNLVVVPHTSQVSLNQETDMILSREQVTTKDPAESKRVRQRMKASRLVYIEFSLYDEILAHPKEPCKFAQNSTRSKLGIATTLHDVRWGFVLTVQQNMQDIIRPPECTFQCVLMTPNVWDLLDGIGCGAYQFSENGLLYRRRYALGHVTLNFACPEVEP